MPSPATILEGLGEIARSASGYAIGWHLAIAALLGGLLAGWHPGRRLAAVCLAAPIASASAFAWLFGNPFNGTVMALVAIAVVATARGAPGAPARPGPGWAEALGAAMVAFAWVYPHFLEDRGALAYLYAAPVGLIPCPSLALAIGFALLARHPGGSRQAAVLAAAGAFYALFGAFRLGVWLDLVLLAGALGLGAEALVDVRRRVPEPTR